MMNTVIETNNESAKPELTDWGQINWRKINRYVERLQKRIFHAESVGNKRKVRDLQRTLMQSNAALLLSIRKVTQINKGKRTAGVDGFKALTPETRLNLYQEMKGRKLSLHKPKPAYRTYIEKKNGKLRPLGIPTIKDRVYQNVVKLALEPQWEARFEPTSNGFRPKRSCHDAIARIFITMKGNNKRKWVFEGDFKGCFDTLNHDFILRQIKGFPEAKLIAKWLKAGFIDNNVFNEIDEGTPQGGIVSPLLANIALHGMESILGIKYTICNRKNSDPTYENRTKYALSRYADDFVIMCETKEDAEALYSLLEPYLKERGLKLSDEKTKTTHIEDGFDFLGFNVRQYSTKDGPKLLIKPSKDSIKDSKRKIAEVVKSSYGHNAKTLIERLNNIITGKALYWCRFVAKRTFSDMDYYVWGKIRRYLRRSHPNKSWKWIRKRYFKRDRTGQSKDRWILTNPKTGIQITKMAWTHIEYHTMIKHNFTPYNATLKKYFAERDVKKFNLENITSRQKMAKKQNYVCGICGMSITDFSEALEVHHLIPKVHGGKDEYKNLRLVHTSCHIEYHRKFPVRREIPSKVMSKPYCAMIRTRRLAGLM